MPTIPQLPPANSVSPADEIPISQGGSVHAVSVGTLLLTAQPVITVGTSSLLGRSSIGSGGPEQIDVGIGMELVEGTVVATGADHARYPSTSSLSIGSDLVISNQGTQMLMPTEFLRTLFSAGQNVTIDSNGVISTVAETALSEGTLLGSAIGELQVVASVGSQDLLPLSQSGTDHAISYANLLNGLTIDEASSAAPASDTDLVWVAQATNTMSSQTLAAIWTWITGKLQVYKCPVIEITSNTTLSATAHNGRVLVCSQPVTLTPAAADMGSGFQCQVVNFSSGSLTLGTGFLTSNGSFSIGPQQTAAIQCLTYSGGSVAYAALPPAAVTVALPGQVTQLKTASVAATTIGLSWQQPSSGGPPSFYIVQYRLTGSTTWLAVSTIAASTSYQLSGLQAGTSYDIEVVASNLGGTGIASQILAVSTTVSAAASPPGQVSGISATAISSSVVTLAWAVQTGLNGALTYTVQSRVSGTSAWTSTVAGISANSYSVTNLQPGTSYDFSVAGVNASGAGPGSVVVSATTLAAAAVAVPSQVSNLVAVATSSSNIQLSWSSQTGDNAATTYTLEYTQTGSTTWTSTVTAISINTYSLAGLQASTSYDFSVFGVNASGAGPASTVVSATTSGIGNSITSISWNLGPSGTYTRGGGAIGVNAHVTPASAAIEFGFSTSTATAPSSWTAAVSVNTDLWGAYVPTPATPGNWYGWVQGIDGSNATVFPTPFVVQ